MIATRSLISSRLAASSSVVCNRSCFAAISSSSFAWMPRRSCATNEEANKKDADGKTAGKKEENGNSTIPEAVHEEIAKLKADLKKMTEKADEYKRAAMYSAAEADTARRIAREDVAKAQNFGITKFAKDVLDVNDTLERAIEVFEKLQPEEKKTLEEHKILNSLVTGVKLSHSVMVQNLNRHGVEAIKANPGDVFDVNFHDAVFQAPATNEIEEGRIAVVTKKGYMLKDRVLRAAQVGVAKNLTGSA